MFPAVVFANVIMPPVNDFFIRHRDELVPVERFFYVNYEGDYVSLKDAPGSERVSDVLENNRAYFIRSTYNHEGESWGYMQLSNRQFGPPFGWIPMNQLLLRYDAISFDEERGDEFYPFSGSYEALKTAQEIVLWPWPGSGDGEINRRIRVHNEALIIFNDAISEGFKIYHAYTDYQGREWVFTNIRGRRRSNDRQMWVCLSDPTNLDIPAFNPPRPVPWPSVKALPDISQSGPSLPLLTLILVAVLASSTAVLIRVFWRQGREKKGD